MIVSGVFVALIAGAIPISFALAITAVVYILLSGNSVLLASVGQQLFGGIESYGLLSLPLFILLGELMNAGGIGRRLIALAAAMLGSMRGGLAHINLVANMLMASILGSTVAQITVMSRLAVPEMVKAGYPKDVSVTITAAGGLLAPIIPPSMIFIIFGVVAQVPIGDLFAAGIVPGIILFFGFAALIGFMARCNAFPVTPASDAETRLRAALDACPALLIPAVIIVSILGGFATPTESAAIASLAAIFIGLFVYKEMAARDIITAFVNAARGAAIVLFLIAAAQVFSWVITFENVPARAAAIMQAMTSSPVVFLLLITGLLMVVGMILDPIPAIILLVPVLLPIATNVYGIDPLQFAMVFCINLTAALLTPPVGTGLFTAALLNDMRAERIAQLLAPFLLLVFAVVMLLCVAPGLSTIMRRLL